MLVIGLTGGIGSGKTTVCQLFQHYQIPILDADQIARELVKPQQPALEEIVATFGQTMLTATGTLDRKKLRQLVFQRPNDRKLLENILHPKIRTTIKQTLPTLTTPYAIVCIPLLFETKQTHMVNRILVVDVEESVQIQRVKQRDNLTDDEVQMILKTQWPRKKRLAHADDILHNTKGLDFAQQQVAHYHRLYLTLSQKSDSS